VCEVPSPSTRKLDRARKLPIYARVGVAHAWLIDPELRTLEVLRRTDDKWLIAETLAESAEVRAEPFDAIAFSLAILWEGVEPPTSG
jgi:Uma2 family endonuclease